jgi:ubiquinone/menaquinone biosynthesis C-methylase UbiE
LANTFRKKKETPVTANKNRVCPVELSRGLDSIVRRWIQNPEKILAPYITQGMSVLDVGCGPGFFSIEIAEMVGATGKVFAADLQEGMLQRVRSKVKGTEAEKRITVIKCDPGKINATEMVDFILAFYVVHEVPDKNSFFKQLRNILKGDGQFLLVEPKLFHVSRKDFEATISIAENNGFKVCNGPKLRFSWSALLRNA